MDRTFSFEILRGEKDGKTVKLVVSIECYGYSEEELDILEITSKEVDVGYSEDPDFVDCFDDVIKECKEGKL